MVKQQIPENTQEEIQVDHLLEKVLEKKNQGLRLSQISCAFVNNLYELSYSFANDETYAFENLRVIIDRETEVPSITNIIPQAVFYENEMSELFGVKVSMISLDYHGNFYRVKEKAPFLPEEARKETKQETEQADQAEEKQEANQKDQAQTETQPEEKKES